MGSRVVPFSVNRSYNKEIHFILIKMAFFGPPLLVKVSVLQVRKN